MAVEGAHTTEAEIHVAMVALRFLIYSASYQSLNTVRVQTHKSHAGRLQAQLLQNMSTSEMWKMVKRKLKPTMAKGPPPFEQLEDKLRMREGEQSRSTHVTTRQWVAAKNRDIDRAPTCHVPCKDILGPLVMKHIMLLQKLIAKLRTNLTTGLDNITALQLKRAPPDFLEALAWLVAWCMEAGIFPPGLRLGRVKFIPKGSGAHRGLTLESLIAKLFENLVVDPIYPCFGKCSNLIAPEQLANRRGASSEIASAIFGILIDWHSNKPLRVLIADIQAAYDNVWRSAAWAKLADSHEPMIDVKRVKELYMNQQLQIVEPGYTSRTYSPTKGVPQGGPKSGDVHGGFTSDIPDELRRCGAGVMLGNVEIMCLSFLDDYMTPTIEDKVINRVLETLRKYGEKWDVTWAPSKFNVLNFNVDPERDALKYGHVPVSAITHHKYLGVIHSTKRPYWKAHYAEKLRTALFLLYNLRSAGLIGGRNSPAAALGVVRSMIWQTMDYGRATARSLDGDHAGVRKKLEAFQISVLRKVRGLSKSAPKLAVFGESGDLPDAWRERRKQMSIAFQMITAESSSVAHRVAMEASSASPKVGLFLRVSNLLAEHDIEARDITDFKNKTEISNWIARRASTEWKEDTAASTRLIDTYAWTKDLRMRGYLKEDFKGRQIHQNQSGRPRTWCRLLPRQG